jgi:hypothetical protein
MIPVHTQCDTKCLSSESALFIHQGHGEIPVTILHSRAVGQQSPTAMLIAVQIHNHAQTGIQSRVDRITQLNLNVHSFACRFVLRSYA